MSKHEVIFNRYIYRASMCVGFELDPTDFLHCEDEGELDMASFFEEWKSLKGLK